MTLDAQAPWLALFQVAAADPAHEEFAVTADGVPVELEGITTAGGRVHRGVIPAGLVVAHYSAKVDGRAGGRAVTADEWVEYIRPSRYCPSDQLDGFARRQFDPRAPRLELVQAVADWVHQRIIYSPGSSRGIDTALDTLHSSRGVCRDFAHLTITLLRALEVPCRLMSAYAPGLSPMDFHAVVEFELDGCWHAIDPTRLAPVSTLARIHHGRDAADTAFLSVLGGRANFTTLEVTAIVDGDLPTDGPSVAPVG